MGRPLNSTVQQLHDQKLPGYIFESIDGMMYGSTLRFKGRLLVRQCILPAAYLSASQNVLARHKPQLACSMQNRCGLRGAVQEQGMAQVGMAQVPTPNQNMVHALQSGALLDIALSKQASSTKLLSTQAKYDTALLPTSVIACLWGNESQTGSTCLQPKNSSSALSHSKAGQHSSMQTPGGSAAHQVS